MTNQLLYLRQQIYTQAQKSNFETHPKVDTVESKIYSELQEIANERGSDYKANLQDQYVEFNVSELNEEANPDHPNCKG